MNRNNALYWEARLAKLQLKPVDNRRLIAKAKRYLRKYQTAVE